MRRHCCTTRHGRVSGPKTQPWGTPHIPFSIKASSQTSADGPSGLSARALQTDLAVHTQFNCVNLIMALAQPLLLKLPGCALCLIECCLTVICVSRLGVNEPLHPWLHKRTHATESLCLSLPFWRKALCHKGHWCLSPSERPARPNSFSYDTTGLSTWLATPVWPDTPLVMS